MIEMDKVELAMSLYKGYQKRDLSDEKFEEIKNSFLNKTNKSNIKQRFRRFILDEIAEADSRCPVVLLSGGVDSTFMLLMMMQIFNRQNITACSIGYRNHPIDESKMAKEICNKLGINHEIYYIDKSSIQETLDEINEDTYRDFFISSSLIPTSRIFKYAQLFGDCIITGDGGDELFCGYDRYLFAYYLKRFEGIGYFKNTDFKNRKMKKIQRYLNGNYEDLVAVHDKLACINCADLNITCSFDFIDRYVYNDIFEVNRKELNDLHLLDQFMLFDVGTELYGVETRKVETAVRMAGITDKPVVSPFLNWEIMNFAASLPIKYKYKWFKRKVLLREIIYDEFPEYDKIVSKSKRGFAFPFIQEKEWTNLLIDELKKKNILRIKEMI